ncbi:Gfo/Idh/MocA family oxidoreductase [Occallatibacter riparius]|uniref:Gfo/Idh/MocA family oxidoreductase n=1 Tax=Occallatibacter riparius TaxID=1002689 RepID=A0A9J7BUD0_9BACT|nr:Gfo/Idh/MocA family oxidoreductase [Occallatibacter riparius]UWZ84534.1 Gfo/Idh/MocA family oxidoreductase [Occallatibacter riparius]
MAANVAVVGHGYWGKNLARNFFELGALRTLCDENTAALEAVRAKYPGVDFTGSYDEVLGDSEIAGVVLATPAVRHYEMAKRALLADKDVFVEKPLALDVKEGAELVRIAAEHKRILMVGHILQYHPAVRELKRLVANGDLGRVEYIYSNRLNIGKIRAEENILWSFAPHDISVLLGLLGEEPQTVSCEGGSYLNSDVPDVTLSQFGFANGVRAHVFVSWLHPVKEQRLVVVGSAQMAVFDDTAAEKLVLYPHKIEWKDRVPTAVKSDAVAVPLPKEEPLRNECQEFLDSIESRRAPLTDGAEGLRVLNVLRACQEALTLGRPQTTKPQAKAAEPAKPVYYAHPTAIVDQPAEIGAGTNIWHFSHILAGAKIGERCIFGQNCQVAGDTVIGNNVKVQNNVSIYSGAHIDDDVFLGPSCVLTNVTNPRSQVNRHSLYEKTFIRRGATVGANATVVCGITLGRYSFIAAGSVVAKDVPDYGLMVGNPARRIGWMSRHGHRLDFPNEDGIMVCPESGYSYKEEHPGVLRCLDLDEDAPLPAELAKGTKSYDEFKAESEANSH